MLENSFPLILPALQRGVRGASRFPSTALAVSYFAIWESVELWTVIEAVKTVDENIGLATPS